MNESVKAARRLIAKVQLVDVRLVSASAHAGVRSREEAGEVKVYFAHSAKALGAIREGVFYVLASLEVQAVPIDTGTKKLPFQVRMEVELKYRVPSDLKVTRVELSGFAKMNGVYNAWPYFREYVQSTTQRMGLPSVTLPVFRIPPAPKEPTAPTSEQERPSASFEE